MEPRYRVVLVLVLVGVLLGFAVHHGATYDDNWPHPSGDQLAEDITGWDGEDVLFIAEVERVDSDADVIWIAIEDRFDEVVTEIEVSGVSVDVEVGGVVQVYGELDDAATTMTAREVVVVNRHPGDQLYKLASAVLGVVLTAGLFLWYWRIDWKRLRFVRRGGAVDG